MYWQLLKRRRTFRQLWLAAVVSLAGDWFTLIALYSMLLERTGKSESVGLMLAARFLPAVIFSPFAGVLADRFHRGRIMVACDLLRAATVLLFLTEEVSLVYPVVFLQMSLSTFFEPAESAAMASAVEPDEIVTANTLHSATWSAMLSVGAVLGGVAVSLVGRKASFLIDVCTYLVSAYFVSRARLPHLDRPARSAQNTGLKEGLMLLRNDGRVLAAVAVKTGWSISGGAALLLYAVLGEREFAGTGTAAFAIGTLLGMRGIGALVGPLLARRIGGDSVAWLQKAITIGYLWISVAWLLLAQAPTLAVAAGCALVAHMAVSTQWTFSSSLIALQVPDRLRGRLFALDLMFHTVALSASSWGMGVLLDAGVFSPRQGVRAIALLLAAPLLVWLWLLSRAQRQPRAEAA